MDHRRLLRANCAECQGLCCVSLAFERSERFGFDKSQDHPCPRLEPGYTCAIHAQLEAEGQAGCASYDCYGAGQRITRLFRGAAWRDDPARAPALFAAFRRLRAVHELRFLLREAGRLTLPASRAQRGARLLAELEPDPDFTPRSLAALDLPRLELEVHELLRSLQAHLPAPPERRRLRLLR
jgi:hypothetical protein